MIPYVFLTGCNGGAGIQGRIVWYVSLTCFSGGPQGAGILGGVVWYATLTGCNEGPQGAGILGGMVWYVSLTQKSFGVEIYSCISLQIHIMASA